MDGFPPRGYVFIAIGEDRYIEEAAQATRSLRVVDPSAHVTLITEREEEDLPSSAKCFDHVVTHCLPTLDTARENGTLWKEVMKYHALQHSLSPYHDTFYVDSDVHFVAPCSQLFDILDYFDLVMAPAPGDLTPVIVDGRALEGYTPYNCGVILYRRSARTASLFDAWLQAYERHHDVYPHDQPAFMEALAKSACRVYVMQNTWNARTNFLEKFKGPVRLIHARHDDVRRVVMRVNRSTQPRLWIPSLESSYPVRGGIKEYLSVLGRGVRRLAAKIFDAVGD